MTDHAGPSSHMRRALTDSAAVKPTLDADPAIPLTPLSTDTTAVSISTPGAANNLTRQVETEGGSPVAGEPKGDLGSPADSDAASTRPPSVGGLHGGPPFLPEMPPLAAALSRAFSTGDTEPSSSRPPGLRRLTTRLSVPVRAASRSTPSPHSTAVDPSGPSSRSKSSSTHASASASRPTTSPSGSNTPAPASTALPNRPEAPTALAAGTPFPPLRTTTTTLSGRPYSVFSRPHKLFIVALTGITGLFSPISSNIFVPAIPTLARTFHRTEESINLAVTVYLVFQAVTPSLFGAMSDTFGRRPIYVLILVIYVAANVGLALVPTTSAGYAGLLVLRCLQATGGSGVIAVGAGVVSDIAEPSERGTYMAFFQLGAMFGPAFGPFLGGVFAETLGWRAIFWFLAIFSGVALVLVIFFMPETLRALVGDGSIPPPMLNASPQMCLQRRKMERELKANGQEKEHVDRPPKKKFNVLAAFTILVTTPEITTPLIFTALLYLVFYSILSLYSTALTNSYHFNELIIGLCYLPSGVGTILASLLNGRQLDHYYRKECERVGGDFRKKGEEFRIERTRLRCAVPFAVLNIISAIALGWCLQARAPLAATLVVNFFLGLSLGTTNIVTVYGQDLKSGQGGAVSAANNLVRCLFGAIGTSVIQIIYRAIGAGWTMVLMAGLAVAAFPLLFITIRCGPGWRRRRLERAAEKKRAVRAKVEAADAAVSDAREGGTAGAGGVARRGQGRVRGVWWRARRRWVDAKYDEGGRRAERRGQAEKEADRALGAATATADTQQGAEGAETTGHGEPEPGEGTERAGKSEGR